jgi:hypothetical protein
MQPNQVSRRVSIEVMGRPSISRRFPLISRQIILSACEDTYRACWVRVTGPQIRSLLF